MTYPSVVLLILDGWGSGLAWGGNAIAAAKTPFIDQIDRLPHALLGASGGQVGLPGHERGNSEVGHLNLGAGRVVLQDSTRITTAIEDRSFFQNSALLDAFRSVASNKRRVHLMGLLSSASVHAMNDHIHALVQLAQDCQVTDLRLHIFTDGRDSDPRDGLRQIVNLEDKLHEIGLGEIQTIVGRYWAMDRDHHWERTRKAYDLIAHSIGRTATSARMAISQAYAGGTTDEFIEPTVIISPNEPDYAGVEPGDLIVFWNFRSDRARQLTHFFTQSDLPERRTPLLANLAFISMTPYGAEHDLPGVITAFPPQPLTDTLPATIAKEGKLQFHIAETEKYAHVTYFFNGGVETPFIGEDRVLVPSQKIATYDLAPEMSAQKITRQLLDAIGTARYAFYVANFANADMVGHTGNFHATVTAVEFLDRELDRIVATCQELGLPVLITADHGNAEQKVNPTTGEPSTDHTVNPVPCYIILPGEDRPLRRTGVLADVAPTVLELLGLTSPPVMTGQSLFKL